MARIRVIVTERVSELLDVGQPLQGFNRAAMRPEDVTSERARRLRAALGDVESNDIVIGRIRGGFWAAVDIATARRVAIEVDE